MESYISINGFPVIASHKLLTDLLRHDMNFTGLLVSDYSEIDRMYSIGWTRRAWQLTYLART